MSFIINHSSMVPIYEQLVLQIKSQIIAGELTEGSSLPSVRQLSKALNISALTVKKAYDFLEGEGLTTTVHGKGTYVATSNQGLLEEERLKEIEQLLRSGVDKAKRYGMSEATIKELFQLVLGESSC